ncbi:MAG: DUF2027 domain-containing protein [Bacteroidales bacterium]|nr:DUF2027 domain-containing protein [Bacteroidales bacterium]
MNFKTGDKVKFLNENDHGTVTKVMNNGIVMVLNSDDFEVPVQASELILDGSQPAQQPSLPQPKPQPKIVEVEKPKPVAINSPKTEERDSYGFYIGFVPQEGKNNLQADLEMYLINDSSFRVLYNFMRPKDKNKNLVNTISGILEPDTKEYIETVKRDNLNNLSSFKFQFLYSMDTPHTVRQPEEFDVKISPQKFFIANYYKPNDFFDENAVIITIKENSLMNEAIKKISDFSAEKDKDLSRPRLKVVKKQTEKEEVDLHLVELLDDDRGMSPKEKLDYQIKVFREKLDEYIKNPHVKKVVFIHGKGNGTLKTEIRRCLDLYYKRYQYQDASFEEYGGGATLVYVK